MDLSKFLFGSGDQLQKVQTMSSGQKQLLQQLIGLLGGGQGGQGGGGLENVFGLLQQYLNPESDVYKNFEAPYRQEFEQQTIPGLAERFASYGGGMGGGLSSSGFGQALGAAGANLQTNLAQMKSGMQRNSIQDILGLLGQGLGAQPFGYQRLQGGPGFVPTAIGAAAKGFGGGF
jgi:hypothetical protein